MILFLYNTTMIVPVFAQQKTAVCIRPKSNIASYEKTRRSMIVLEKERKYVQDCNFIFYRRNDCCSIKGENHELLFSVRVFRNKLNKIKPIRNESETICFLVYGIDQMGEVRLWK